MSLAVCSVENDNTVEFGNNFLFGEWITPDNEDRFDTKNCIHSLTVGVRFGFTIKTVHFCRCPRARQIAMSARHSCVNMSPWRTMSVDHTATLQPYTIQIRQLQVFSTIAGFVRQEKISNLVVDGFYGGGGIIIRPEPWSCWPQTHPIPNRQTDRQTCQ